MQYRKKISEITLGVIVMNVLIPIVLSACKKDKPSREQHSSNLECYTIYKNFVIEKIHMSRVTIEGVPANKHTLFLLKTCIAGCNPERKVRRKGLEGPWIWSFEDGLADTIYRIEFKTKTNKMVYPYPLHWNKENKVHCNLLISEPNDGEKKYVFYEGDYEHLPFDIANPVKIASENRELRFIETGVRKKDTLYYLISFQKKWELPDSIIIVLPGNDMKAQIDNMTTTKYNMFRRSYLLKHQNIPDSLIKAIQKKRQKELLLNNKKKNKKNNIR